MPRLEQNKNHWGNDYAWPSQGDEWSQPWGGVAAQWYTSILPRIYSFIPTDTIVEIAPGFGRWTNYLKDSCRRLIVVDLNENCIDYCKRRFRTSPHIKYHVNDGKSLHMIPDDSVDFIFSFDSLVHVEADIIQSYLNECAKKLSANGVGFFHHSNIGMYQTWWALKDRFIPVNLRRYLTRKGLLTYYHWRAFSVTAKIFEDCCERAGLKCVSQELINWRGRLLIDCFSVFTSERALLHCLIE